jgi:4-methylaminobutanoate oxidase (formaldehyde-forming)
LLAARREGVKRRLATFTLERPAAVFGGEAILRRGKVLGVTTSGNFGHTVGKPIVFGYLPVGEMEHRDFEIEAFGERHPAVRHDGPLWDPRMERLKS